MILNKILSFFLKFILPVILVISALIINNKFGILKIYNATLTDEKNISKNITLPLSEQSTGNTKYIFKFNFEKNLFTGNEFHITAGDYIEKLILNGNEINIEKISQADNGFNINLKKYLKKGLNSAVITVMNTENDKYGLSFSPANKLSNIFYLGLWIIFSAAFLYLLYLILEKLKFNNFIILILLSGFLVRLWYYEYTDYNVRTYDVLEQGGHLDYIKYIADNKSLPKRSEGWEYHQPPLYYASSAVFYSAVKALDFNEPYKKLQFLSLIYFFIFLVFGVLIIQKLNLNKFFLYIITCLFIFWPSGIIHSVRIGNDVLSYLFFGAALFFLIEWTNSRENYKFIMSVVCSALTVVTKANGVILFGITGIMLLIYLIKTKEIKKFILFSSIFMIFFLISFSINFADNIYSSIKFHKNDWLVGDVINTINRDLFVGNNLFNFTFFDFETFLKIPFTSTWNDIGGRQYFWNFLLKTSLFAEFTFNGAHQKIFAILLSSLFLGMLIYMFISFYFMIREKFDDIKIIHLLNIVLSLTVLIAYRAKIPACCNGDFRYIFPAIISFCYFYGLSLNSNKKAFNITGLIMAGSFILLSALFFIDIY